MQISTGSVLNLEPAQARSMAGEGSQLERFGRRLVRSGGVGDSAERASARGRRPRDMDARGPEPGSLRRSLTPAARMIDAITCARANAINAMNRSPTMSTATAIRNTVRM